ncbi:hypothetical protein ZOSMA_2G00430 [Zostera marina]|uniref:Movement protein binding protein 2C n=1 Tax=Zostera marina TaxID=29655 RepID=A0A0K9PCR5_ZOSMR|nr:hypothetical protein ZOSMA_2G00430 [Zostera marina]
MERQRLQQNSQRPKLKMKQDVAIDSISDRQQCRTINLQINAKSSSSTPPHSPPPPVLPPNVSGNVDRGLYDDLVEIVPLIETLMDQRGNSAYKRSARMISTPNPTQQKKVPVKKQNGSRIVKDRITANSHSSGNSDDFSMLSSKKSSAQKDREEVSVLREQLDELQKKLLEKEDSFKSSQVTVDELKHQVCEKDEQLKSLHSELNTTKIKLADKQAAVESLDWQTREANNKVEKLQAETDSKNFEISAFMKFFQELMKNTTSTAPLVEETVFDTFDHLPNIDVDDDAIEETRLAYEAALAFAIENPCDEALIAAFHARTKLQSLVV